ncbi:MAG: ribosome biogenesis factor YjgA [Gammaproteobacteria bacterium]
MKDIKSPDREIPSKSQRKRDMAELQTLGKQLVEMPSRVFVSMDLPDNLREAVEFARAIRSNEARRRQLQYIGRIMRSVNADQIRSQLQRYKHDKQTVSQQHHDLEELRESLISDGETALTELLGKFPDANNKTLRQLIRNARTEHQQDRSGKACRALFRHLRDLTESADKKTIG